MSGYRKSLKKESNNSFDVFYKHFKNKIRDYSTMAGCKDIYNWLVDDLKELSNISHNRNYNYDFSSGYGTIAKELIKRAKKDFEWLHEDFKMPKNKLKESVLWDDLTDVEKIAYEYANDYINQGYSIEDAVTQGCFDMMNNVDENDDIDDYEDPDPRKIKKFLMRKYKAPFGRKSNKENKPLYIIKDNHGNQLSAPSEDDYALWDRVAAMEARGKRGLSVVAYTESLSEVLDDRGVERYGVDGEWWYFTTHGVQPGSVPKGIKILNVIDTANGTYFCSDRVLNTSELRDFDIKEKYPSGLVSESLKESADKYFKIGGYYSGGVENGMSVDRVEIYDIVRASDLNEAKDILKSLLTSQEKYRLKNDYNNNFDDFMSGENYFITPATDKEFEDFNNGIFKESFNMKVKNLDEATLNKQFRKDIKNKYKANDSMNDVNREKRADTMSMAKEKGLDKDPAMRKFMKDYFDDKYPIKPFKYKFPKHLEKHDFPFYVTYYQEYPIYEPAEGGYYYAGSDAVHSKGFETREEAMEYASELKNESGESGWESYSNGYMKEGKYIGEGERIVIETRNDYLSQEKGWEPYQ